MTDWPQLNSLPHDLSVQQADNKPQAENAGVAESASELCVQPFLQDDGMAVSLHFSLDELQSRMNKVNPLWLEVDYTRTMMGFLLFSAMPANIAMIGLGGGSLARFCYAEMPRSRITVLEINPHVIALRKTFQIPDDDARFEVIQIDGAQFISTQATAYDVLLVDGFDHTGQPPALCSQQFYDDCFHALKPGGVLVVNLHYDDADYPLWLARLQRSFNGQLAEIPALEKSNCIVFASRPAENPEPAQLNAKSALSALSNSARQQLKAEFARITWTMRGERLA